MQECGVEQMCPIRGLEHPGLGRLTELVPPALRDAAPLVALRKLWSPENAVRRLQEHVWVDRLLPITTIGRGLPETHPYLLGDLSRLCEATEAGTMGSASSPHLDFRSEAGAPFKLPLLLGESVLKDLLSQ